MTLHPVTVNCTIIFASYCNPCDPPCMKVHSCHFAEIENAKDYAEYLSMCEDVDEGAVDIISDLTGEVFYSYKRGKIRYNGYDKEEG